MTDIPTAITTYKGFEKNWSCRGFQYEIGKTYTHDGAIVRCTDAGFHSCLMPFDVWNYYPLSTSVFATVEAGGKVDHAGEGEDSKIASASITIRAEIHLPDMIRAAVDWIVARAKENIGTGDSGHAAATGNSGHAAATGDSGHAAATGYRGYAAATGYRGHAAATGDRGHAAAIGDSGHAAATGDRGHAAATGYSGHAAATGYRGHAAATGNGGHAAATGDRGHAAATGDSGHAAATGYSGHAAATGDSGHAAATGDSGIAASLGINATAMAGEDGWIVLAAWADTDNGWQIATVRTARVGGPEGVKAGVSYRLTADGVFLECAA